MADKEKLASVENCLVQRYNERGYLVEDEVIDCCIEFDLDLAEIDAVCDRLLKRNIIFRDSASTTVETNVDDDDVYDRSHINYDDVFGKIEKEYPSCEYLVEQIKSILPPQHKEWRTLIKEAKSGNSFAYERLILMYLRTILKRAYDFSKTYYCEFEDCFQNAVIGFINAINKYDVTSPDSFVTYFQWWLVQSMSRESSMIGTIMRYPVHYKDRLVSAVSGLDAEYFLPDEIASMESGIEESYYEKDDYEGIYGDLDRAFNENFRDECAKLAGDQFDYNHMIPYRQIYDDIESETGIEDIFVELDKQKIVRKLVDSCLKERERDVILQRYGFDDGRPKTLEEVGTKMGVTRERIRQIESKALRKLSIQCEKKHLFTM